MGKRLQAFYAAHRRAIVWGLVALAVVVWGGAWLIRVPSFDPWTGLQGKTAWDLADLLIVPLALAGVAYLFSERQKQAELQAAAAERENDRQIARDREEESALQTYYDRMSDLLLTHKLRESAAGTEVRSVARALTLATLRRLNGERKGMLIRFLAESELITGTPVISLEDADLTYANLRTARLDGVVLRGARLKKADLTGATLQNADLDSSNFRSANLFGATLRAANFQYATFVTADLTGADLSEVVFFGADLHGAKLAGVDLTGADLIGADIEMADFEGALVGPTTRGLPASLLSQLASIPLTPAGAWPVSLGIIAEAKAADPAPAPAAPPAARRRRARAKE